MLSGPIKRKLDDISLDSQPPIKRHRKDETTQEHYISVRFSKTNVKFKKSELVCIEFCNAKLERWSLNIDNNVIDLSLFSCITPIIFAAIIHLQQLFNQQTRNDEDQNISAAKSLLTDNIKIDDLPTLFEACKILLVTQIFNEEIFEYYFDHHPIISFEKYKQMQKKHENDAFITSLLSKQISSCNVMNDYSVQEAVYDRYNKIGCADCPYIGNIIPNGEYAARYAFGQIVFEKNREIARRLAMTAGEQQTIRDLKKGIDVGLCASFEDMMKFGGNVVGVLNTYFLFINDTFCRCLEHEGGSGFSHKLWNGLVADRSHFCFYSLAYIAHRIWVLHCEKNAAILSYFETSHLTKERKNFIYIVFSLFDAILMHDVTKQNGFWDCKTKMNMLVKQRISDVVKFRSNWKFGFMIEARDLLQRLFEYGYDSEWIIANFILKCENGDCKALLRVLLGICTQKMDEINISASVNDTFERYLGVKIKKLRKKF